jgi:hypothetical protein
VSGGCVRDESFGKRLYVRVTTREHRVGTKLRVRVRAGRVRERELRVGVRAVRDLRARVRLGRAYKREGRALRAGVRAGRKLLV